MFHRLFEFFRRGSPTEKRSLPGYGGPSGGWLTPPSQSGINVNPSSALSFSPVFAAINAISTDIASLPFRVYRTAKGGVVEDTSHPIYELLTCEPNPDMGVFDWEQTLYAHALGWGNGYSAIERDTGGYPTGFVLLDPSRTEPVRDDRSNLYYQDADTKRRWLAEDVIHLRGLGFDGIKGYSPITLARNSIGLGMAAEVFGGSFYGNSAIPNGFLRSSLPLTSEALAQLRESIGNIHGGPYNAHRLGLLPPGVEWQQTSMSNEDSQFLATREFSVVEVCRWFNINPIRLQDWTKSTYANAEQAALDYVRLSLRPWMVRLEREIARKCFTAHERRTYSVAHDTSEFLRGDKAAESAWLREMSGIGVFSVNESRKILGYNSLGPDGDQHRVPLNSAPVEVPDAEEDEQPIAVAALIEITTAVTAGQLPVDSARGMLAAAFPSLTDSQVEAILGPLKIDPPEPAALPAPSPPSASQDAVRGVVAEVLGRMVRLEVNALRRAYRKPDPNEAVREFYHKHSTVLREAISPALLAYGSVVGREYDPDQFATDLVAASQAALQSGQDVEAVLTDWEANRTQRILDSLDGGEENGTT